MTDDTLDLFGLPVTPTSSIPRKTKRLIEAAASIAAGPPERTDFLHAVLCQVGMPRKKALGRSFERSSGSASILLEAGKLWNGTHFVDQPLPYGAKPRLVMIHVSTEAVKTRNRTIPLGDSIRQFLIALGIDPTGGKRGNYTMFKRQMEALAACRMTLGMTAGGRAQTIDAKPISKFEAWLTPDDGQLAMWPGLLELSQEFYDTLIEHAVPLNHEAIVSIKDSAMDLDVYSWLAHRLCRVNKADGVSVSWKALKEQFGQEYERMTHFRAEFLDSLRQVSAVYPDAKLEQTNIGLKLYPSRPPIPKTQVRVQLPDKDNSRD